MLGLMKVGADTDAVGLFFGYAVSFSGIIGSAYCGIWLARRMATRTWLRATLALVFTAALLMVNSIVLAVGCISIPKSL